jgi:hypothetical protein
MTDTSAVLTGGVDLTMPPFAGTVRTFYNNTAKTITVHATDWTGSSTGVAVASGKRQQVYFDPAGFSSVSGTCTVTNGSASLLFSGNQTLAKGAFLTFSSQPGAAYQLASAVAASTVGSIKVSYNGTTSSTATTQWGADFVGAGAAF